MEVTDVIDYYMVLRTTLREYEEHVFNHGMKGVEKDAFPMIYNNTHMTAEILNWYQFEWAKPVRSISKESDHDRRQQNAERINELTKHLFVSALSAIEYSSKHRVKASQNIAFDKLHKKWKNGKWVYLSSIMAASRDAKLMDIPTFEKWDAIIELRNIVVHNNGHAESDKVVQVENVNIPFSKGDTVKINMGFCPQLTGIASKLYHNWLFCFND